MTLALNYSTTWNDETNFINTLESTWIFSSEFPQTNPQGKGPGGKAPRFGAVDCGPKKVPTGTKRIDYCDLELKQSLVVISLILITTITIGIIYSLIKNKIREQIMLQWKLRAGKISLVLMLIALITFFVNSIAMTYYMFGLGDITIEQRPWLRCFGKMPYQMGRLSMELFFILRLHFIFGRSARSVQKWILISLMILSFVAFICGVVATLGSRSVYNWFNWDPKVDTGIRLVIIYRYICIHNICHMRVSNTKLRFTCTYFEKPFSGHW